MTETIPAVLTDEAEPQPDCVLDGLRHRPAVRSRSTTADGRTKWPDAGRGRRARRWRRAWRHPVRRLPRRSRRPPQRAFEDGVVPHRRSGRRDRFRGTLLLRRSPLRRVESGRRERLDGRGRGGAHLPPGRARGIGGRCRPDPVRDEVPVAFVVASRSWRIPVPSHRRSAPEWCAEATGQGQASTHEITSLDELPRTSVGKIRKFLLKEAVASKGVSVDDPDRRVVGVARGVDR